MRSERPATLGFATIGMPWVAGVVLLVGVPLALSIGLSAVSWDGIGDARFVGFGNYRRVLQDPDFAHALVSTCVVVGLGVIVRLALVAGLGILLAYRSVASAAARAAVFAPSVVPDAAYALVWLWLLNPLEGPLAVAASSFGAESLPWLVSPGSARVTLAVVTALQVGEGFVLVLAARRALPTSVYEAASLDGASPWFSLRHITLPLLAPLVALLAVRDLVVSLSTTVAPAQLLTDGGPDRATTTIALYAYEEGFRYLRLGNAAAVGVLVLLVCASASAVAWRLTRRWVAS